MAERVNEFMKTWGGVVAGLVNFTLAVVLVGFGVWVVKEVNAAKLAIAEVRAWQASHVAAVEVEKKTLKLEIESETQKAMRALVEQAAVKQDRISDDVRTTDREVRNVAAQMGALKDTVQTMTATMNRMQADVRQALIDGDFKRSEQKGP